MKLGLIGYPLGHSWSRAIHAYFLKEDCYRNYELKEEALEPFLKNTDLSGFNVTIPYKQKVMPCLDEIEETARIIGAVNTVVKKDGILTGFMLDSNAEIKEGDRIITSGIGRYPAGIILGRITKAGYDSNKQLMEISVKPEVDFTSIDKVSVII